MDSYARYLGDVAGSFVRDASASSSCPQREADCKLNAALRGYPRNHTYRVSGERLVPGVRLYRRWRQIERLFPHRVTSLLDVAGCKGFFVLATALRQECRRAVGIDCVGSFVEMAEGARQRIGRDNARFEVATLAHVADRIEEYGGTFDVVLLLNAYHYFYWGSGLDPACCRCHDTILSRLAKVCGQRVLFTAPLDVDDCPGDCRRFAAACHADAAAYTKAHFLAAASKFFDVSEVGRWGKRPVLSMSKRAAG